MGEGAQSLQFLTQELTGQWEDGGGVEGGDTEIIYAFVPNKVCIFMRGDKGSERNSYGYNLKTKVKR